MLRKHSKKNKNIAPDKTTKGGWQIDGENKKKKSGMSGLLLLVFFVIGVALIAFSFVASSGSEVASISATAKNADNNGKIVHVTGNISSGNFTDPMFKISHRGIGIKRIVEMYQWVEVEGQYSKEWKSEIIALSSDSSVNGGRSNPPEMPFFSESWKVDKIDLGKFDLSEGLIEQISSYTPIELTSDDFAKLNEHGRKAFQLFEGKYFFGLNPNEPRIGDIRVRFETADSGQYTVLAKQQGNSLVAHRGESGLIERVSRGAVDLKTIAKGVDVSSGGMMPWIYRGIGAVCLVIFTLLLILKKKKSAKNSEVAEGGDNLDSDIEDGMEDAANSQQIDDVDNDIDVDEANIESDAIEEAPNDLDSEASEDYTHADLDDEVPEIDDDLEVEQVNPGIDEEGFSEDESVESADIPNFIGETDDADIPSGIEMIAGDDVEEQEYKEQAESNNIAESDMDEGGEVNVGVVEADDIQLEDSIQSEQEGNNDLEVPEGIEMVDEEEPVEEKESDENVAGINSLEFVSEKDEVEPEEDEIEQELVQDEAESESSEELDDLPPPLTLDDVPEIDIEDEPIEEEDKAEAGDELPDLPSPLTLDDVPEIDIEEVPVEADDSESEELPDLPPPLTLDDVPEVEIEEVPVEAGDSESEELPDLPPPLTLDDVPEIEIEEAPVQDEAESGEELPDLPSPQDANDDSLDIDTESIPEDFDPTVEMEIEELDIDTSSDDAVNYEEDVEDISEEEGGDDGEDYDNDK